MLAPAGSIRRGGPARRRERSGAPDGRDLRALRIMRRVPTRQNGFAGLKAFYNKTRCLLSHSTERSAVFFPGCRKKNPVKSMSKFVKANAQRKAPRNRLNRAMSKT